MTNYRYAQGTEVSADRSRNRIEAMLTAYLDGVRERAEAAEHVLTFGGSFAEAAAKSQRDIPALLAALEAVLELHKPYERMLGRYCETCIQASGRRVWRVQWPCPTVRRVESAAGAYDAARAAAEADRAAKRPPFDWEER